MMIPLKKVERPRELKWYQAGSMLYGDWGTSKAYVLGIAFALSGHASWFYLALMAAFTGMIGFCYTIVCRVNPDGGGVYSSVKGRSRILAVIGALLLVADYAITASLSALDAFHYFHLPHPEMWAIGSIVTIGALNWFGPGKGGSIAMVIAVAASVTSAILFFFTIPHLPNVQLTWPTGTLNDHWIRFTGIVLALSGVEAVANMTGIMQEPVQKTSSRAIWPVLIEVTCLTFLLGIAMNAIPGLHGHAEDMLRVLANHYIGPWYGHIISIVFGFLLLSAVNTAITDLVSIQFLMAKDKELPAGFAGLNRYGMPALSLAVAVSIPCAVLAFEHDIVKLAALYAIGVVGAITLNLGSCATNSHLNLKKYEKTVLYVGAIVLFFIELTIASQKHSALLFVSIVIAIGLFLRFTVKKLIPVPVPGLAPTVNLLTVSEAKELTSLYQSSCLVALRSLNTALIEEAAARVKAMGESAIYINFVEQAPPVSELPLEVEPSRSAVEILAKAQSEMEKKGITAIPVWQMGDNPGHMIAKAAQALAVNTVMIGVSQRSALINLLRGDILRTLAKRLPQTCRLVISG